MRLILFLSLISLGCMAQDFVLSTEFVGEIDLRDRKKIEKIVSKVQDSADVSSTSKEVKAYLYKNGYYLSKAEFSAEPKSGTLKITPGSPFKWGKFKLNYPENFTLALESINPLGLSSVNSENFNKHIFSYLDYLQDNGYPFAQISIPEYQVSNDSISGELLLNPGPFVSIDSLSVKGYDGINPKKYKHLFLFKKGMPYSETYVESLSQLVNQIEYLEFSRSPAIAFSADKTVLYLYLKEVKSNQIDGAVGLNTEDDGSVTFNGDFNLRLLNSLNKGEEIKIRWRRPDDDISELDLGFALPLIFNTPFVLDGKLNIYRQDSSFVNTKADGIIKYLIRSGSFINLGANYHASNVISDEDASTNFGSFNTVSYKIGYERSDINRVLVPTSGNIFSSYVITGTRNTDDGNTRQIGWNLLNQYHLKLKRSHIIMLGINSEGLLGDNLFENELFRIGGLKTLRGFNEQSIFASTYAISTIEYRYMIGEYDYLTVFTDVAAVNNQASKTSNQFYGIGAGINFRTRGGIFSLFYALGRDDQNGFDFRTSKIHFGYINRF